MGSIIDLKVRSMNILHVIKKHENKKYACVCVFIHMHPVSLSKGTCKAHMQGLEVEFCID